ncbi:uncharacterized protein LOC119116265 isoform X1 [Syngnathus acus]|uniref:uncharacterized protein LOC119116265 isoform X1 n=1 Tax=Syngnathus acus TaxID=161584 RepID=UPI001885D30D|nr:uncharacterized protein LOC119116265 isoform X1 [Syngnathus acus]XP_037097417.1 uncharacterized protein LOC119116265 isoform X1 [Syngnathus acus]
MTVSSHEQRAPLEVGPTKDIEKKSKNDASNQESSHSNIHHAQVDKEPVDKSQNAAPGQTLADMGTDIIPSHVGKGSKSHKSKSSKSSSRSRPGTATGLRPGALSPRLGKDLADLESTGPAEGIESTWPRRIMVRKRTVRQGGAVHNLPILPPLPSVISALEKRRPHSHLHFRPGHHSENPLLTDVSIFAGRCSLKEPPHQEQVQGANLVGRASLKEQNLEHWRVYRDLEDPRRCITREKQGHLTENRYVNEGNDPIGESDQSANRMKETQVKAKTAVAKQMAEEVEQEQIKIIKSQEKVQESGKKDERHDEIICDKMEEKSVKGRQLQTLEVVVAAPAAVAPAAPVPHVTNEEEGSFGEEHQTTESWDSVLQMVNTIWDDGAGGDSDSFSGSLQRWPLLRPPLGFGGSHPPSSAASELSLSELEKRARELDSDLEHLDLSRSHSDGQDLYRASSPDSQKETYRTHPRPQREKGSVLTGLGSKCQVRVEFSSMLIPATDAEQDTVGWSFKSPAGTSTSPNKEDSSPDSNLTLESDSSGVFLSLSNQSQEGAGSDSDQPISGSDLGSSNTSLEKDGDDGALKEWGREESAELQWCYPSLLSTTSREDVRENVCGDHEVRGKDGHETGRAFSTYESTPDRSDAVECEAMRPRRKVTLVAEEPLLPPSPLKHPIDPYRKAIRSSGLDSGDIDPFAQADSFVYLAVSEKDGPRGDISNLVTDYSAGDFETESVPVQHFERSGKTRLEQSDAEPVARAPPAHLAPPRKAEEGDFLCTDSFVYLAAPACLLLGPEGSTSYSGSRESDSESSGSEPVDESVLGCGSVAGDSDWDSDLSDSGASRPSRAAGGAKSTGAARHKRLPPAAAAEPRWDSFGETTEPETPEEPSVEQEQKGKAKRLPVGSADDGASAERSCATKKVTWQFKPAQRSVCTGSRKEKEKDMASFSSSSEGRGSELGGHRPAASSSSSLTSSPSSSSSSSSSSG